MKQQETILSKLDGEKYTFVHPKAKSDLGQLLSPLAYAPFVHPLHGRFDSVLGYYYWISCGKANEADALRSVSGSYAITVGRGIRKQHGIFVPTRQQLREMTYATILKIEEYCKNNNEDTVTIKHLIAGNNKPYVHVRNIRSKDTGSIYGRSQLTRVLVMSEYKDLSKIYQLLGNIYKTDKGRQLDPSSVLEQVAKLGGFELTSGSEEYGVGNQLAAVD